MGDDISIRYYEGGSWKETDTSSYMGWFCFRDEVEGSCLGARNLRRSLSPLHSELEALIWVMHYIYASTIEDNRRFCNGQYRADEDDVYTDRLTNFLNTRRGIREE